MMKCEKCGAENTADARFCQACGESITEATTDKIAVAQQTVVIPPPVENHSMGRYIVGERFKILKKLGKGGMGEVLLAEDVKLKRQVAIKTILKSNLDDTNSKIRFLREAQTASQLDHANICTIYEIYEENDKDYIVMQFIDGVTLDQIIGVKTLSLDKTIDIAIQICNGMAEAHARNIIHRDIKPGNIMIDNKGVVKILDFGLAKVHNEMSRKRSPETSINLTEKGFVMGTVAYISPEQAKGKPLDLRSDIFSFGIVLYELLEGHNPFKEEEQIETLYNVLNKVVTFTREIPEPLKFIVLKSLEKNKEARYANFDDLKKDLETFRNSYLNASGSPSMEVGGQTEIIDVKEQAKFLLEIKKNSDKEDLGALVSRIKKFKASTEQVMPSMHKKINRLHLLIPFLVVAVALILYMVFKPSKPIQVATKKEPVHKTIFYIYLHPFEDEKTGEKDLPDKMEQLLVEALNQFEEFKVINKSVLVSLYGTGDVQKNLAQLNKKFKIKYELTGKITREGEFYTIDARLNLYGATGEEKAYTPFSTGSGLDSLVASQVDSLTRDIYSHLFPEKSKNYNYYKVATLYGNQWTDFALAFEGIRYWQHLEFTAESYLTKVPGVLIAQYYLADLYAYDGRRKQALGLIQQIMPRITTLTPALQLKVRALAGRLNFVFNEEIANLERLKDMLPYDKEVLYQLGEAFFHHASPTEAISYYNQALALDQKYSNALNHLGYCYSYLGDHVKARELFQEYRTLGEDESVNAFDSAGDGYFFAGNLVIAESMKLRATMPTRENSSIAWPLQTLADIYILKANYTTAQKVLDKYEKLQNTPKDSAYVQARLAYIEYVNRHLDSALTLIDRSLALYDSDVIADNTAEAHWFKGVILLELGRITESRIQLKWLEQFRIKYKLDAANFNAALKYEIHLNALIAEKENRGADAEKAYKTLLIMKDKLSYWITYFYYQYFHTQYASFLLRANRYADALKEVNLCLEFNADYIPALWVKAELLEHLKKNNQAYTLYEQISQLIGEAKESNYLRDLLKTKLHRGVVSQ